MGKVWFSSVQRRGAKVLVGSEPAATFEVNVDARGKSGGEDRQNSGRFEPVDVGNGFVCWILSLVAFQIGQKKVK